MIKFPIKIEYYDTREKVIIESADDLPNTKRFFAIVEQDVAIKKCGTCVFHTTRNTCNWHFDQLLPEAIKEALDNAQKCYSWDVKYPEEGKTCNVWKQKP